LIDYQQLSLKKKTTIVSVSSIWNQTKQAPSLWCKIECLLRRMTKFGIKLNKHPHCGAKFSVYKEG